jgi:hypothetical protein
MSARLKAKKDEIHVNTITSDTERKPSDSGMYSKRRRTSSLGPKDQPVSKKLRTSSNVSKATMRQIGRIAKSRIVSMIEGEDKFLVHPDFRLQRHCNFEKNLTSGIPRHDRKDVDDVLKNASYATDMFQYFYAAEVSLTNAIFCNQGEQQK